MKPITDFHIACYHDISEEVLDIYKRIPVPHQAPKSITHVFDEEKSVHWNREQVEAYNQKAAELRREAVELRAQSLRNLNKAVIKYMLEYEALDTTPEAVVECVLARAQKDHNDDWWSYLSDYLEFAEAIVDSLINSLKEN